MRNIALIARRELAGYFTTPVAYVFIVIFLAVSGSFTFYIGGFFDRGQADLQPFFNFHAWLYLLLIPAISMRLWAEERKSGTIELLMTLPVTPQEAVIGKFLSAWIFAGVALALTFPLWITVNFLGEPDNGVILASYIGSFIMAGAYLAIGASISALTKNQVIAFILGASVCFLFTMSGVELVLEFFRGWAPDLLIETVASMSFLTNFQQISKGVIDIRHIIFFGSLIFVWLWINLLILDLKKAS
ncbi:ABC transporter permease subunit [Alphaproteobacteria bacterium HT1-32]|nr:ABC transporter permease subunit [Alphaproteobacteria bacterium HT1-32]